MSTVLKDTRKIDRLSQLPPELLGDIFDLVAVSHELCLVPLSKSLQPFHEKALYRYCKFDSFSQFHKFAQTLNTHPSRASHPRQIVWKASPTRADLAILQRILPSLSSVIRLELLRYADGLFHPDLLVCALGAFTALKTCVLCEIDLTSGMMQWLQQKSSLAHIEFFDVFIESDQIYPTIPQVESLALGAGRFFTAQRYSTLFAIQHSFPSSVITKLDLSCSSSAQFTAFRALLTEMHPTLRTLRLHSTLSHDFRTKPVDDLLPRFPSLQILELDSAFTSYNTHIHLLNLPRLVDLRIDVDYVDADFRKLFQGPERLRHLRTLGLEFVPVPAGENFELECALQKISEDGRGERWNGFLLLDNCRSFTMMGGWNLPFGDVKEYEECLELADEIMRIAKGADIKTWNNLHWIRCYFRRKIVEYYNRGIGRLYFYNDTEILQDARKVANTYKVELPPLEINQEEALVQENVEWFKVKMTQIEADGIDDCYAFNLRY